MIPHNKHIVAAFKRGQDRGKLGHKFGRAQCPYGERRAFMRDAWFAGYDLGVVA